VERFVRENKKSMPRDERKIEEKEKENAQRGRTKKNFSMRGRRMLDVRT